VLVFGGVATLLVALFGLAVLRYGFGGTRCDGHASERALTIDAHSAVMSFVQDQGRCPAGEPELLYGRYLRAIWTDRWGNQLFYTCVAAAGGVDVTVRSAGPDRAFWTGDDVVAPSDVRR